MATITKTVGVGGDYAKWSDCWNYLLSLVPIQNDYEFRQISDITEDTWPNMTLAANYLDAGGHSIKFYCAFADSHQGSPTRGFKTNLSGVNGHINPIFKTSYFVCTIEGLYLKQIGNALAGSYLYLGLNSGTITSNIYNVDNLFIEGFTGNSCVGISILPQSPLSAINAKNIKIWNCYDGINFTSGATSLSDTKYFENITIKAVRYGYALSVPNQCRIYLTNCVSYGASNGDFSHDAGQSKYILKNCADGDGSIVAGTTTNTGCFTGVTASFFKSVLSTSSSFLAISPSSGLYAKGSLIVQSTNTSSIEGYPRPNAFGAVSIGASEPNVEIDFTAAPLDPAIHDTVSFTSIINEATIPTYSWNLDDGNTDSAANPTERYTVPGLKTISLTVTDDGGRMATVTKPDYIDVKDYGLGFTAVPEKGQAPLDVQFTPTFEVQP